MTIPEIHDWRAEEQQWLDQRISEVLQGRKISGEKYWPLALYPPILMPRPPSTPVAAKPEPRTYAGKAIADLSEATVHGVAQGWNALSKERQKI